MDKRRKKKDSAVASVFLILVAALVVIAAVYVIFSVFSKISMDYKKLEKLQETESQGTTIEIEKVEKQGWNDTDEGWKYLMDDGQYAAQQWLEVEGFLYYFDEQGIMVTGQWEKDGQIYTCHDTKGYLKDIQVDLNYVPESNGENLDSLARTNAFWCYLNDEDTGLFKTILYRKTVENKVKPLGDENNPEKTTRNSMRAHGDYVYYLPKVKEGSFSQLTSEEKSLCNVLTRMIPGQKNKEIIAENVGGYFFLDDVIYYSQNGKIYSAVSGTEVTAGQQQYDVIIENDECYLTDPLGNPVQPENGNSISVGDRVYEIESGGRIKSVSHGQLTVDGATYYLKGNGNNSAVCAKTSSGERTLIKEAYGVQSYCIVDKNIYFSAYVDKPAAGDWHSQIFRANLDGSGKTAISQKFLGSMNNMYYFEDEGEIYGEYHPSLWKNAYGSVAVIGRDGSLSRINDANVRSTKYVSGNDMLELVMVKGSTVICLWHDCLWNSTGGISSTLWSKAVSLNALDRTFIETYKAEEKKEEETTAAETDAIIRPLETTSPETMPQTVAPSKEEVILGTDPPTAETAAPTLPVPSPTIPPMTEAPSDDIEIIPLG